METEYHWLFGKKIKILPPQTHIGCIWFLIDEAMDKDDKEWFMELTNRLKELEGMEK